MTVVGEAVYEGGVLKPDQPLPLADRQRVRFTVQDVGQSVLATRSRAELAAGLVRRLEACLPFVGDVALPAHLNVLKRDLSRCHPALRGHPEENDFVSLVTLIESAIASTKWKALTAAHLEALRDTLLPAVAAPYRFEDFEAARVRLGVAGVATTPRIDLDALSEDDLTDGEEA